MFEFLSDIIPSQAVTGIYYALRLIEHSDGVAKDITIEGLPTEPSHNDCEIAQKIAEEIERFEGVPHTELSAPRAKDYMRRLIDLAEERVEQELKYVKEMRQQFMKSHMPERARWLEYVTDRHARQQLLDSIHRSFQEPDPQHGPIYRTLGEICEALSAKEALVSLWDGYRKRLKVFMTYEAYTTEESDPIVVEQLGGMLFSQIVDRPGPISLFGREILNQVFASIASNSAVNAPIWVDDVLHSVLSVVDIDGLHQEEPRIDNLIQEIANEIGREIEEVLSLGFSIKQRQIEATLSELVYKALRGPMLDKFDGFVAVRFTDAEGNALSMSGGKAQVEKGKPFKLIVSIRTTKPPEGEFSEPIRILEGNDAEVVTFSADWMSGELDSEETKLVLYISPDQKESVEGTFSFKPLSDIETYDSPDQKESVEGTSSFKPLSEIRTYDVYVHVYQSTRFIQGVLAELEVIDRQNE